MYRRWNVFGGVAILLTIIAFGVSKSAWLHDDAQVPLAYNTSTTSSINSSLPTGYPSEPGYRTGPIKSPGDAYTIEYVLAKTTYEDISWLQHAFPNHTVTTYTVDAPPEFLLIPANKGREAMVYLTHLITRYDSLSDITVFLHPHQYAWHNSDLHGQDALTMLSNLNPAHVARVGYFPLRCQHDPGCPNWNTLDQIESELDPYLRQEEKYFTTSTWNELNPELPAPKWLSEPCCSQFALSSTRARSVPVSKLHHYRNWLLNTTLDDQISGRWMEYTWQVLFTGEAEFCPSQNVCFCDGYGICFGGEVEFQHWWDVRDKVHCWEEEARRLREEGEGSDREKSLWMRIEKGKVWLEGLQAEAVERGKSARNRAEDCGREWRDGDGF